MQNWAASERNNRLRRGWSFSCSHRFAGRNLKAMEIQRETKGNRTKRRILREKRSEGEGTLMYKIFYDGGRRTRGSTHLNPWSRVDKVIVILDSGNERGVVIGWGCRFQDQITLGSHPPCHISWHQSIRLCHPVCIRIPCFPLPLVIPVCR